MYFKKIEMTGFKSFVDHTSITFGEGITAIVGPNGCGKSNISDAIRWVLGEQRPKFLRGAKMEDFIFSGSASRKPSGMAEVAITISNVAGIISKPELAEFDEVTVSRRLYRSGESEYMINRTLCRLKDIVDVFLDTGISTRAFSIIEQDQVQRIVTSKPENRRFIIEEAAGIMKYKNRRHVANNKLEGSRLNLERVNDIISELERQKNSLKRQASKAERYRKYEAEFIQQMLAVSADEWKELKSSESTLTAELERLEEVRTSFKTDISARQNHLFSLQTSINDLSEKLSQQKEESYRLESLVERNEGKIKLFAVQNDEALLNVEKLSNEVKTLDGRLEETQAALVEKGGELEDIHVEIEGKRREVELKKKEAQNGQAEIEQAATLAASGERELADALNQASGLQTGLASCKTRVEMLQRREEKINAEKDEAISALREIRARKEEMENELLSRNRRYAELKSEYEALNDECKNLISARDAKQTQLSETKMEMAQKSARLESLKEVERSHEGYQDGTRSLLEMEDGEAGISAKLRGTLLDRIKVNQDFEAAIELVLGERLQALIVNDYGDATAALNHLKGEKLGRATFLITGTHMGNEPEREDLGSHDGVIGYASDMIEADDEIKPFVARLLRDVVLVNDIDAAVTLHREKRFTCVTPHGDVIDRWGVVSGGSLEKSAGGILERKRAMEELAFAASEDEKTVSTLQAEFDALSARLGETETARGEKEGLIKDDERLLIHEGKDLQSLEDEIGRHESRIETFKAEIDTIEVEKESLLGEIGTMKKEMEEVSARKEKLGAEIKAVFEKRAQAESRQKGLAEAAQTAELELASLNADRSMASAEKERMEKSLSELSDRLKSIKDDIEANVRKEKSLEEETTRLKEDIHNTLEKRHSISQNLTKVSELLGASRAEMENKEAELNNSNASLEQTVELLNNAKIQFSETSMRLTNLIERTDEHDISQERIETFDTEGLDMEECRQRLGFLKERLSKMGDVNLSAIDDFGQVSERLTFLTTQRDDLVESINDIRRTIEKIDRTTHKLFEETFVKIRENFRGVFKKLFNGGEADMFLTNEDNLMESGLEIYVRPPGKRRQNINLLSAGEKAMTAVSILFSVFMEKSSPFCLLDEVDAPLDDANIGRFKLMLDEFADRTQFLVITHNQKTMSFADRLYGITMQEPGISKVLSVDLVDTGAQGKEHLRVVHG
ncbi:MAG: chromosome segregation protein SMC [Nitrospinota bacterium]